MNYDVTPSLSKKNDVTPWISPKALQDSYKKISSGLASAWSLALPLPSSYLVSRDGTRINGELRPLDYTAELFPWITRGPGGPR